MIFRQVQKFTACNAPMMSRMEKKYCWELVLAALRENHQLLSKSALDAISHPSVVLGSSLSCSTADQHAEQCCTYESANPSLCFFETSQELDVDSYCHRSLETFMGLYFFFARVSEASRVFVTFTYNYARAKRATFIRNWEVFLARFFSSEASLLIIVKLI